VSEAGTSSADTIVAGVTMVMMMPGMMMMVRVPAVGGFVRQVNVHAAVAAVFHLPVKKGAQANKPGEEDAPRQQDAKRGSQRLHQGAGT
jgi:hypothetical protein